MVICSIFCGVAYMFRARSILLGFCAALAGDPDDFLCSTFTWLNGNELRRGVAYLVNPGSTLAFGTACMLGSIHLTPVEDFILLRFGPDILL